ncbi:unnamed protein product [Caenorhabditis nigoni]
MKQLEAGNVYYSALEIKEPTNDNNAGEYICTVQDNYGMLTATFIVKFEVPGGAPSLNRAQIMQQTYHGSSPLMHAVGGPSVGNVLVWKSEVEVTLNIERTD